MLLLFLCAVCIVFMLWSVWYSRNWDERLEATLQFKEPAIYAGETVILTEVIENRKKMPLPILEVGFHAKKELKFGQTENTSISDYLYKRDIFSAQGYQKITRQMEVEGQKRGHYQIQTLDLVTYSLFMRKRYSNSCACDARLYVYAKQVPLYELAAVCQQMTGIRQCKRMLYEDPFTFRSIREYRMEDPMKTVNWKATAKTGELMVNTFDSVMADKILLFLDVADEGILKYEHLVEESIAVAASFLRRLVKQGMEAGLVTNMRWKKPIADRFLDVNFQTDGICLMPTAKNSRLPMFEKLFAEYQKEDGAGNFLNLIDAVMREGSAQNLLYVVISKNVTEELLSKLSALAGKEGEILLLCPINPGEAAREKVKPLLQTVPKDRIRVLFRETALF